jgi:4-hydroxy-tetrahydrodipicolinate reductase
MGATIIKTIDKFPDIRIVSCMVETSKEVRGMDIPVFIGKDKIPEACKGVDIWLDFTTPQAFVTNFPEVIKSGVDLVVGTTGWYGKFRMFQNLIKKYKVSAVVSPNFSPLVNTQFKLTDIASKILGKLDYSLGVVEEHHEEKKDAPSGTADKLANIIMENTNYAKIKMRSRGISRKEPAELDMASLRLRGTVGDHEVRIRGDTGRMNIDTSIYSRQEFAEGALMSVRWLSKHRKPGIVFDFYKDVLGI